MHTHYFPKQFDIIVYQIWGNHRKDNNFPFRLYSRPLLLQMWLVVQKLSKPLSFLKENIDVLVASVI